MADHARHPGDDLTAVSPDTMSFFELLRRLERPGRRFGHSGGPGREPARLGQGARMAVATRDIARVMGSKGHDGPLSVEVEVIGLLGPEGPMPLHLTRWVLERVSQRWFVAGSEHATSDTSALDFCNMLQHRMIALYWRAWGDAQLSIHVDRPREGRVGAILAALAGIGMLGQRNDALSARETHAVKLDYAMQIAHAVPGSERLTAPAAALLGVPVRLVEFVGSHVDLPRPLQTRLGRAHAQLAQGAVIGPRVLSRQDRAELRVGPVDLVFYLRLADDPTLRARLRHLVLHLVGRETDIDLRPILAEAEVPEPRLGRVLLGRTVWLPSRQSSDRDDLRLPHITREAA